MEDGKIRNYYKEESRNDVQISKARIVPPTIPQQHPNGHEGEQTYDAYTYKCEIKASVGEDSKKVINPLKICIGKRLRTPDDDIQDYYSEIKKRAIGQFDSNSFESHAIKHNLATVNTSNDLQHQSETHMKAQTKPVVNKMNHTPVSKGQNQKSQHIKDYADFLGQQPTVKFKCRKCCVMSFKSLAMLKEHQLVCRGRRECLEPPPEASTTGRATRKVYLCSACGTYYENWNLFLHMREVHNRHICLFCLGMFSRADKLAAHLISKHNVRETHYDTAAQFLESSNSSLYIMCCSCDTIYTEKDNFAMHMCQAKETKTGKKASSLDLKEDTVKSKHIVAPPKMKQPELNYKGRRESLDNVQKTVEQSNAIYFDNKPPLPNDNALLPLPNENAESRFFSSTLNNTYLEENLSKTASSCSELDLLPSPFTGEEMNFMKKPHEAALYHSLSKEVDKQELSSSNLARDSYLNPFSKPPTPPLDVPVLKPAALQSPLLTSLLMKSSPKTPNFKYDRPPLNIPSQEKPVVNSTKASDLSSITNNITVEKSKEPGLKLKFNLQNAASPVIVNSTLGNIVTTPLSSKPPNRMRRPPKRYDLTPPLPPVVGSLNTPPQPSTPKSTIYDLNQSSIDSYKVPKLTVRVPREILERDFSSESSDSGDDSRLTMDVDNVTSNIPAEISENYPSASLKELERTTEKLEDPSEDVKVRESLQLEHSDLTQESLEHKESSEESFEPPVDIMNSEVVPHLPLIPAVELKLEKAFDKYPLKEFLKICVNATLWKCVYCNHARKIAVNCKSLALHILEQHRFSATVDSITAEELLPETINIKIKARLGEVENVFVNLGVFDCEEKSSTDDFDSLYECFQCYFKTPVHKELYFHNRKLHAKASLLCMMCKSNFYSYSELLCHMCPGDSIPDYELKFRCCFCQVGNIPSTFRLMVHLRKVHDTCDVCLERCWNQTKLSMHVWKHKLHHFCYRCGIAYRNKPDITKHLFWKHGTESIICKKCMQKKWPHIYHFCIPPNSFVCEICNLAFSKAVFLKVHKRFHSEEYKHSCKESGCEEKFVSKKLLERHAEIHKPLCIDLTPNDDIENDKENMNKTNPVDLKDQVDGIKPVLAAIVPIPVLSDLAISSKKSKKKKLKEKDLLLDVNLPELNLSESDSSEDEIENKLAENLEKGIPKPEIKNSSSDSETTKDILIQENSSETGTKQEIVSAESEAKSGTINEPINLDSLPTNISEKVETSLQLDKQSDSSKIHGTDDIQALVNGYEKMDHPEIITANTEGFPSKAKDPSIKCEIPETCDSSAKDSEMMLLDKMENHSTIHSLEKTLSPDQPSTIFPAESCIKDSCEGKSKILETVSKSKNNNNDSTDQVPIGKSDGIHTSQPQPWSQQFQSSSMISEENIKNEQIAVLSHESVITHPKDMPEVAAKTSIDQFVNAGQIEQLVGNYPVNNTDDVIMIHENITHKPFLIKSEAAEKIENELVKLETPITNCEQLLQKPECPAVVSENLLTDSENLRAEPENVSIKPESIIPNCQSNIEETEDSIALPKNETASQSDSFKSICTSSNIHPESEKAEEEKMDLAQKEDVNIKVEEEKKKTEQQVLEIWDNFKQYQAKMERQKTPPLVTIRKHVCDSDHDYCLIPVETNGDHDIGSDKKGKRKRPRSNSGGSSSSSDSDSSCSCGSNCSCTSSGSSSSSSDSDSSLSGDQDKTKSKMGQRRESQASIDVTAPEETPVLLPEKKEPQIRESDLETEESETDEEFYDEHPQKVADKLYNEKPNRNLMMLASVAPTKAVEESANGIANEESKLPPVPEEMSPSKKKKAKRRKKPKSPKKRTHQPIKLNIPKDKIKPTENITIPANKITISLNSNTVHLGNTATSTAQSNMMSSSQRSENQRASKRRRRPNKFYGYTSDEETNTPKTIIRESFNPYLPPKLEWRKEDLPSPATSVRTPIRNNVPVMEPPIRLKAPVPDLVPPQVLMNSDSDSDTDTSDDQLNSSQPFGSYNYTPSYNSNSQPEPEGEPKVQTFSNNEDSLYNPENVGNPFPSFTPQVSQAPMATQNPYASHLFRFRRPQNMRKAREGESVYCYCRCPYDEVSEMIGCDAPGCTIEWFHFECVGIMVPPKGKWYCPDCKIRMGLAPNI